METYVLTTNPEPWQPSRGSLMRKNGKFIIQMNKPEGLRVYQEAIREEIRGLYDVVDHGDKTVEVDFIFYRNLESNAKHADATNMQKALEDALQGILFKNDRQVIGISSSVAAQGPGVDPCIVIIVSEDEGGWTDSQLPIYRNRAERLRRKDLDRATDVVDAGDRETAAASF